MDAISQELGIPKKQIQETRTEDRFLLVTHKSWLKCLAQHRKLQEFPIYLETDEWPVGGRYANPAWTNVYLNIFRKYNHKVIPLPCSREESSTQAAPMYFSQLIQHISQTNHQTLWKHAYKKYSAMKGKLNDSRRKTDTSSLSMLPYDSVLREIIVRMYGCPIVHAQLDRLKSRDDTDCDNLVEIKTFPEAHINLYPVIAAIETSTHFVIIYSNFIENNLMDCVTYSPAILAKSHNKPLFLIYQLLQLMKSLHERGLLLGSIKLSDIFLTENLWLYVMPQLSANILKLDTSHTDDLTNATTKNFNYTIRDHLNHSLKDYCEMWCHGQLSNFDYLTILNNLSGRRLGYPGYHHIMPWVTDFTARNGTNWRDLKKSKYRLNKGDALLDLMYTPSSENHIPHHVSDVLSEITYYVYMARRTPRHLLCKHVRPIWVPGEYPISIQRLQEWTPDECIPEFFTEPLVFKSMHEDLADLEVPVWASCPEDFITKHREALESQYVSERLHHWIDLNFGYKLTGSAAIKAKNVCLSLVNEHKTLCERGIVQLFTYSHPPKQYQNQWTGKLPPRIHSQIETKQRLTRSSEDLSNHSTDCDSSFPGTDQSSSSSYLTQNSPKYRHKSPSNSDESVTNIERSTSLHSTVHKTQNQIYLPKDYNPIGALIAIENIEIFLSKTFYPNFVGPDIPLKTHDYNILKLDRNYAEEAGNSFTNRIFTETYEASLFKDTKRLQNLNYKNCIVQSTSKNYKHILAENRNRELLIIGCITVEIFLAKELRPFGSYTSQTFDERLEACLNVLKYEFDNLPKCVQYPIKLLLLRDTSDNALTDKGLPQPTPHQMLEPLLSNELFPFSFNYTEIYTLLKTLEQFNAANNLLNLYTFFDCDGHSCSMYEHLDKTRFYLGRKIAECKVKSFVIQSKNLLQPIGYEQFNSIEIILPHVIDMLHYDATSVLVAWYLFDSVAMALGPKQTQEHLLEPIILLYDVDNEFILNGSYETSQKFGTGPVYRNRKSLRIYHYSFLLRLIVRFGLKPFLENFVSPLIEAVGGSKESEEHSRLHYHNTANDDKIKKCRSTKNFKFVKSNNRSLLGGASEGDCALADKEFTNRKESEEMFAFEGEIDNGSSYGNVDDTSDNEVDTAILKIIDNFDLSSAGSLVDLRLNHSTAEEATEYSLMNADHKSPEDSSKMDAKGPISPTIPIPTFRRSTELNTIDCEIGSKKSIDSSDFLAQQPNEQSEPDGGNSESAKTTSGSKSSDSKRSHRISEMSAESLIWLSHRLGPVLTAKYISRNLLKMLTLCYVGQENQMPDNGQNLKDNLMSFTISNGKVVGDVNASKVLECLTSISTLFGDNFILLQYFPHISELIALCKKRITPSLEGGLIASLHFLKFLVPCLSDSIIMDQLHDVLLKSIIHPIIRLLASTRFTMPNGFLARSVLARKLLDILYVLAVRIGPEMTKEHLCIPALQRFFLIFDKAYGISDHFKNDDNDLSPSHSLDDSNFVEIRRDGNCREWRCKGSPIQIGTVKRKCDSTNNSITPPGSTNTDNGNDRAKDEICDVFTPHLAHIAYLPFLKYLGEQVMCQFIKNLPLILNLCHEHEQPKNAVSEPNKDNIEYLRSSYTLTKDSDSVDSAYSNSFGSAVVGNRLDIQQEDERNEMGAMELLDIIAYKNDQMNTVRHLRGNWLAYWEHEIGRSDKDTHFNLKQIKLQTYAGHSNSVRSLLCLDNENSFMSASKDKTVKLWSLRSEGDGSKVSFCQFSYTNHRKSVHSLAFLESLRLTISCDSGVHLWDPFIGAQVGQLDSHKLTPVSVVKTYPAPSPLVLAGTAESTLKIIDGRMFAYVNEWKVSPSSSGSVRCIAVSPSGSWIAVGLSSGQLTLFDGRTGLITASWKATDGELLQLNAPNEQQIISTSLDHNICAWSAIDGSLLFHLKNPAEPTHCILSNGPELLFGTPSNRIGIYTSIGPDIPYSITKLRSETFRGVVTSLALLPLNQMLLIGGDSGNISLLC